MADVITWVTTIIAGVIILIASHISITIILPKLKDFISPVVKDEKTLAALMTLLIILVAVLGLKAEIDLLLTLQNNVLNLLNVFKPGLDLILSIGKYIGYLVLGFMVVLGLKFFK